MTLKYMKKNIILNKKKNQKKINKIERGTHTVKTTSHSKEPWAIHNFRFLKRSMTLFKKKKTRENLVLFCVLSNNNKTTIKK